MQARPPWPRSLERANVQLMVAPGRMSNHRLHINEGSDVAADRVEREILIEAPAEVVWRVITEPGHISRWFSDEADVQPRTGGDGTLTWKRGGRGADKDADLVVPILVVEAEPYRRFCFRWNHPEGVSPDEGNSALVEFSLTEEPRGTRLRVIESAIDAVINDEESKTRYLETHEHGWEKHLGELLVYVRSNPLGEAR
jgi:uncharacterized protein YndB with AHSA1/START domain